MSDKRFSEMTDNEVRELAGAVSETGELRTAAKLMRERAHAATGGHWHHMCMGSEGCAVINDGRLRERKHVAFFGRKEWKADHADAQYVASMPPAVALAVADLLDKIAWMGELDPDMLSRVGCDEAIATARTVLATNDSGG